MSNETHLSNIETVTSLLLGDTHMVVEAESRLNDSLAALGPDGREEVTRQLARNYSMLSPQDPECSYVASLLAKAEDVHASMNHQGQDSEIDLRAVFDEELGNAKE